MMRCGLLGEKLGHSYSPAIHAQLAAYLPLLFRKRPLYFVYAGHVRRLVI